jgi:F-type H+-transporting ATPase subunit epsilon
VTLHVELVIPEGEIWTGTASMVIAKTVEGDIGVLTGHSPVLGILTEGSLVRVFADEDPEAGQEEVSAAVSGGFFSVADDRVSILARQAQLGAEVDRTAVRAQLDGELEAATAGGQAAEESATARYLRALLRAAGDEA